MKLFLSQEQQKWLEAQVAAGHYRSIEAAAQLLALFSRYNTGSPQRGIANGYATKVLALMDGARGASPANPRDRAATASQPMLTLRAQFASFATIRQK